MPPSPPKTSFPFSRLIPALVLLAGLGITFLVWSSSAKNFQRIQQEKFDFRVNEIVAEIHTRLADSEQVLVGVSGLFAASEGVSRKEFQTYVAKLQLKRNFPGMQGVGFSLRVPAAEKARHENQIRREGFPHYTLHPEGERPFYTSILYIEPFDWRNQRAFGYDMYSEPVRQAAMRRAWVAGRTTLSDRVTLVQETQDDVQHGFLMYIPIYSNGVALASAAAREAHLVGWAYASFRMNNLMKGILGKQYGEMEDVLDLAIYDGGTAQPGRQMFGDKTEAGKSSLVASRKIEFGAHTWTLQVRALPKYVQRAETARLRNIAYLGITISLLVALTMWLLLNGRARALALAENMTARLREEETALKKLSGLNQAILDSATYALISTDTDGVIRTFNAAAERMLGYPADEVVGKATPAILHDAQELARHAENLSRELGMPVAVGFDAFVAKARLGQADENEWSYIRKDGSRFPVLLSVTALRGENGEITGYLGVGQNIEESKKLHQQLLKLSRTVEQSPVSVVITDIDGKIEYVNPHFCLVSGYPAEELIGNNPSILQSGKTSLETYRRLWQNILAGGVWQGEFLNRRKNGELYWERAVITGWRNEKGEVANFIGVKEDITEQKNAEREVQRFKNILDNTLDMIFMFDPETLRIVYASMGNVITLGYTRHELMDKPFWEINPLVPEHVFRSHIAPLLTGDKTWMNYETVHTCKDGQELPVEVFLQLVEEEGGNRLFVAISRDLTERRKIDQMKNEFISTVSHELRTPLTSISGALGLVRGGVVGELPAQAKPMIEIAYNNAERLVRLINDILDMEKIESGKMRFDLHQVELMPLIEQSLADNQAYAAKYRVRYVVAEGAPGVQVNVDTDRLLQVMANLLSNAAKFSPPGDVGTISVKDLGAMVRVAVSDHGAGIPEEFRSRIFQKFSQADSSDTKQKGGTGLGLNICKAIVAKMGGMIGFESTPGGGTTFYFDLPHAAAPPSLPPRILVCEGDQDASRRLREMLTQRGYRVDIASSAEEAKQLLADQRYQAMTLDTGLPGQDGVSLVQELKADKKTAELPILMISAKAGAERERLGDGAEVVDWIGQPAVPDRIFSALQEETANVAGLPVILHVEDDPDLRQVLKSLIVPQGDVAGASTLEEATKMLEGRRFDLIILDVGLPDGSGLDLLPCLANKNRTEPVLIFSAHEISGEMAFPVDAALVKSRTSNQQLLDTIMKIIARHGRKA